MHPCFYLGQAFDGSAAARARDEGGGTEARGPHSECKVSEGRSVCGDSEMSPCITST